MQKQQPWPWKQNKNPNFSAQNLSIFLQASENVPPQDIPWERGGRRGGGGRWAMGCHKLHAKLLPTMLKNCLERQKKKAFQKSFPRPLFSKHSHVSTQQPLKVWSNEQAPACLCMKTPSKDKRNLIEMYHMLTSPLWAVVDPTRVQ